MPDPVRPGLGADLPADDALIPPHPDYRKVLRIRALLMTLPLIAGATMLDALVPGLTGLFILPALVLAALVVARVPPNRYRATGHAVAADRLRVVRGLLIRSDTVVPYGRVQHIDVSQGPLERRYNLATLTLHTAGNHNASVHLPGLANARAIALREEIRAHIRKDLL